MLDRLRDLARRLRAAWPAAREVARDPARRKAWLLGARGAQIALAITLVGGLFLVPPLADAFSEALFPARQTRGGIFGLGRRRRTDPRADTTSAVLVALFWLGGLGTSGALLVLRAPLAAGRRPEDEDAPADAALAETLAGPSALGTDRTVAATDAGAPADSPPPATVGPGGRYVVEDELGRGGMGVVHRARDTVLDREVALKQLPPALVRNAALAERFRTEAKVLAKLTHRGIVQVFDLVESDEGMWMAMELVPGGSLDARLEAGDPLPFDRVCRMGGAITEALAHAHAEGVVHRDLKPHNVLLTADGEPKITDFGLAKIAREGPKLTQAGAVLGSPAYMSPEQAAGKPTDARADVYALGVTLFEMATGRCPFTGDTASVLSAHITAEPPSPTELGAEVPEAFAELLNELLAKDPDERPDDLTEVARRLREMAPSAG